MNKLQRYSKQLEQNKPTNRALEWRGQTLKRLTDGWDDALDAYANLEQNAHWLTKARNDRSEPIS